VRKPRCLPGRAAKLAKTARAPLVPTWLSGFLRAVRYSRPAKSITHIGRTGLHPECPQKRNKHAAFMDKVTV
jgi:hypothetical protein